MILVWKLCKMLDVYYEKIKYLYLQVFLVKCTFSFDIRNTFTITRCKSHLTFKKYICIMQGPMLHFYLCLLHRIVFRRSENKSSIVIYAKFFSGIALHAETQKKCNENKLFKKGFKSRQLFSYDLIGNWEFNSSLTIVFSFR